MVYHFIDIFLPTFTFMLSHSFVNDTTEKLMKVALNTITLNPANLNQ